VLFRTAAGLEDDTDSNCTIPTLFSDSATTTTTTTIPNIHVVMGLSTGEFFANLYEGMTLQSVGIGPSGVTTKLSTPDNGDVVAMAGFVREAAMDDGTVGIVTVGGTEDGLCEAILESIEDYRTPVVSFDFDGKACHDTQHVLTAQADYNMASLVLEHAASAHPGPNVQVGYVSDLNYIPLINRNNVWETYKAAHNWTERFFINDAANYSSREDLVEVIAAELEDNPGIDFVYAPWDYLTGATLSAIDRVDTNSTTAAVDAVYGADINEDDIALMTGPGSLWEATAGGDPQAIGAALIRMISILVTDGLESNQIDIPSLLFTQSFLLSNGITSMVTLRDAMPELKLSSFMEACWIATPSSEGDGPTVAPTASVTAAVGPATATTPMMLSSMLFASIILVELG
jgi:ABC-type sugar transport system substrate-binding protein